MQQAAEGARLQFQHVWHAARSRRRDNEATKVRSFRRRTACRRSFCSRALDFTTRRMQHVGCFDTSAESLQVHAEQASTR